MSLAGKIALITGAGRGIGAETARRLAAEGATVLANDLDESAFQVTQSINATGGKSQSLVADILAPEAPAQLVEQAINECGTPDILVHCAGFTADDLLEAMDEVQWS
jgi:3-oxoacyl-[acyl-carrier protein] reductase